MAGETDPRGGADHARFTKVPLFISTKEHYQSHNLGVSLPRDNALLEVETKSFRKRSGIAGAKFEKIRKKYGRYRRVEDAAREWDKATEGLSQVVKAYKQLDDESTHIDYQTLILHEAGGSINAQDKLKSMQKIFAKHADPIDDFVEMSDFSLNQPINLKIGGVSIREIHDQDRKKGNLLPVSALLRFFMTAREATYGQMPPNFFEENNGPLEEEFPQMTINSLSFAECAATAMLNCAIGSDEPKFLSRTRSLPDSAPATKRLVEKTREFNSRFKKLLQTPDDPDFEATKSIIEQYMQGSSTMKNFLVHIMGLSSTEPLQEIYRSAVAFADDGQNREFYGQVTDMLRGYTSAISDFADIYTRDDMEEIFRSDGTLFTRDTPTVENFRQEMVGILRNKPRDKDEFELELDDVTDIEWGGIIPPQTATITFSKGKPMIFDLKLHYENSVEDETTEEANVFFEIDAKKGTFEWNFIEDPQSEDMQEFHNSAMRVVGQALGKLSKKLELDKAARMTARQGKTPESASTKGPTVIASVAPETIKVSPAHRKQRKDRSPMEALEESSTVEDQGIQRHIVIPEDDVLNGLMRSRSIDIAERSRIKQNIEIYNAGGRIGSFKMLSSDPKYGRLFVYKVQGVRVLLREGGKEASVSNYTIIDICKRGDVYKKNRPWG